MDDARTIVASHGQDTPSKTRRRLSGDLDNIVLKALRKDPARRYTSAEQLSEDIRNEAGLWCGKALGIWKEMQQKKILSSDYAGKPEEMKRMVAKCTAASKNSSINIIH